MLLDARRDGQDVGVEDDVLGLEAGLLGEQLVGAAADFHLALERVSLAEFVERHDHSRRAVLADEPRLLEKRFFAALQADRVADALALHAFQARLQHRPLGAVDHDRNAGDLGLGGDEVEEADHRGLRVQQVRVHVHVQQVGASADLLQRDLHGAREVAAFDEAAEADRTGDVGALADHHEARIGPDLERLEPAEAGSLDAVGDLARRDVLDRLANLPDVLRSRAAAAPGRVQVAGLGELLQQPARGRRLLVVPAERVGQPGVRVAEDVDGCYARHGCDVRPHLGGSERAVDACGERLRVLDRRPERFDGLPREVAAAAVDHGHRDEERQVWRDLFHSGNRGLAVECVEDRFDEEEVDAAFAQRARRLRVTLLQLVERDVAV